MKNLCVLQIIRTYICIIEFVVEVAPDIGPCLRRRLLLIHHRVLCEHLIPLSLLCKVIRKYTYHAALLCIASEALTRNDVRLFHEHRILVIVDHEDFLTLSLDDCHKFGDQDVTHHILFRLNTR